MIVVVSGGVHHADGSFLFDAKSIAIDLRLATSQHSRNAQYLSQWPEQLGIKSLDIELQYMQRCASHAASKVDLDETLALGAAGVEAVFQGKADCYGWHSELLICYRRTPVATALLTSVKLVPRNDLEDKLTLPTALTCLRPLVAGMEGDFADGLPSFLAELS